jgi:5-(hydroxymethyl)furfural/furfural oxidase
MFGDRKFDVVIAGGGAAGCVLAHRLSARSSLQVLLLEAGGDLPPGEEPEVIRDTFHSPLYHPEYMWPDLQVHWRDPSTGRLPSRYEQGRVMGGGSSVNAMNANRPLPQDLAEWVAMGAKGWDWSDCLPYLNRLECDANFSGEMHGADGPIPIQRNPVEHWPPYARASADALADMGFPFIEDWNADFRDGLCHASMNIRNGERVSAARAYLDAATRRRSNLTILCNSSVERILAAGAVASGVAFRHQGVLHTVSARHIIVSAGAIFSPSLLLRSGIGPADHLQETGIEVIADLRGVGRNLQDHPVVAIAGWLKRQARHPDSQRATQNGCLRFSSGVLDCPASDMFMGLPNKTGWHALGKRVGACVVVLFKPYSRGRIRLQGSGAAAGLRVEANLLDDDRDTQRMMAGLRLAHRVMRHRALEGVVDHAFPAGFSERVRRMNRASRGNAVRAQVCEWLLDLAWPSLRKKVFDREFAAGVALDALLADEHSTRAWLNRNVVGFFHPVGSCRMGAPEDSDAVVDPSCRVRGIQGLRVVDASVMPSTVRANTHLTTLMIAEKASDTFLSEL